MGVQMGLRRLAVVFACAASMGGCANHYEPEKLMAHTAPIAERPTAPAYDRFGHIGYDSNTDVSRLHCDAPSAPQPGAVRCN
jgi:hypothetical protein